jgi:glucose-fructose oxidoreductase
MTSFDPHRRRALAGLGTAVAAVAGASPVARAAASPADARGGIAIVGIGGYGRLALERLAQSRLARPAALVTGSPERARELASRHGIPADGIYGYDDYARLADDARVQALHLCLPVGLHAEHARRGFEAGKHVLCEKPLAASVAEAEAMLAAANRAGRVLMPAYRAWFSEPIQDLRRRVRERVHGALVSIDAHKGFAMTQPAGHWRFDPALAGGGCLTDIGIYSVQLQRWLGGGLPTRVSAFLRDGGDPRFARVESDVAWIAEFDGGVLATGSASWRYRLQNRVRVGFAEAWVDVDPATPAIGERVRIGLDGPARIEEPAFAPVDQIPRMYDAFAEACGGRADAAVATQDGIDDLRVIEAIMQSARSGRPVELAGAASPRAT